MKRRIRTNGVIIALAVILVAFFPDRFFRSYTSRLDYALGVIGLALIFLGLLLRVSSRGYKSENSQNGFALVKGGPYALVRNPMYLGIFTVGTGTIVFLFQWWVLAIFVVFLLARYLTLTIREEALLVRSFGPEYQQYLREVPRFFPGIKGLFRSEVRLCLPLRLSWINREISSVLAVPLLSLALRIIFCLRQGQLGMLLPQLAGYLAVIGLFFALVVYLSKGYEKRAKTA